MYDLIFLAVLLAVLVFALPRRATWTRVPERDGGIIGWFGGTPEPPPPPLPKTTHVFERSFERDAVVCIRCGFLFPASRLHRGEKLKAGELDCPQQHSSDRGTLH